METMDRKRFLRNTIGMAGAVALAPYVKAPRDLLDGEADARSPAPRPVLRLPGGTFGFPSPFTYVADPGYWRMSFIYDTLLWEDATGHLLPWLAKRHEMSHDGLTHTFVLRDNIHWHDGRPLTAEDVVFTFEYFAKQALSPLVVAQVPPGIAHVKATHTHTVEVRLLRAIATFATSVAGMLPIVPKHIWSRVHRAATVHDPRLLVGSGPYRLASFSPTDGSYLYMANDKYFLGKPFVKRIELVPVDDELTAVLAGDTDAGSSNIIGVGPDALAPFRSDRSFGIVEERGAFTFPLFWNLSHGGPLADVRVRRACAHAINRHDIVNRLFKGNALAGNPGFLPPTNPFYTHVEQYPFDRAVANRLLDQAGYRRGASGVRHGSDGRPLRFTLVTSNAPVPPVVELVIGALGAVGIELTAQAVDLVTLFGRTTRGLDQMAITLYPGPSGPSLNGDADYLRQIYSSRVPPNFNHVQGYANHHMDLLAQRQLATLNKVERRRLIAEMQRIAAHDIPVLPLYYSTLFHVFKKSVFNQWHYTPGGVVGVYNKQAFVTGRKSGLKIRPST